MLGAEGIKQSEPVEEGPRQTERYNLLRLKPFLIQAMSGEGAEIAHAHSPICVDCRSETAQLLYAAREGCLVGVCGLCYSIERVTTAVRSGELDSAVRRTLHEIIQEAESIILSVELRRATAAASVGDGS